MAAVVEAGVAGSIFAGCLTQQQQQHTQRVALGRGDCRTTAVSAFPVPTGLRITGRGVRASPAVAVRSVPPRSFSSSQIVCEAQEIRTRTGAMETCQSICKFHTVRAESVQVAYQRRLSCFMKASQRLQVTAAVKELEGSLMKGEGLRFAVVVGRFNEIITKALLTGALETFKRYLVLDEHIDVIWVPGSFEIPVVAQSLATSTKYDAVLCIGAVIRGDTSHYDAVANSAASGIMSAAIKSGVPCIFGVLTCDNMQQAIDRAGGKAGNKGAEAAITAIEMASLFQHHIRT